MADEQLPPELTPEFLAALVKVYRWLYRKGYVWDATETENFINELHGAANLPCPILPCEAGEQWEEPNG